MGIEEGRSPRCTTTIEIWSHHELSSSCVPLPTILGECRSSMSPEFEVLLQNLLGNTPTSSVLPLNMVMDLLGLISKISMKTHLLRITTKIQKISLLEFYQYQLLVSVNKAGTYIRLSFQSISSGYKIMLTADSQQGNSIFVVHSTFNF